MEIGKKQVKTIQDYRHNIKLLKYYLKKQQKLNETLKYKKGKQQKRQHIQVKQIQKPKERIYTLNTTIAKLNIKLKNMGLSLGDLFRMADSTYEGQINKQQFQNCIQKVNSQIQESLINQMFYAIDTNLNGILSEDEYFQFLCAYGGTESKEAVNFQKKILQKFGAALKKKSMKPQQFISHQTNPIPVYDFSEKLKKLNLNQNQTMILLKIFDPSQEGIIKHETFIAMMQTVKQKDQKQLQNQEFQKNVQSFCKHLRDSKLNPLKLFEEADVDKKDGVSPIQLQQAFKKFMPSQTSYQIKKWVEIVNLNNDKQITRQQFVNSIRGFYSLNQLQKFSTQYQKEHPNSKKGVEKQEFSNQKIIKMLSDKIQDKKMANKDAFNLFDINKNGTLDKQELLDGLTTLGIHIGQIGKILAVFDSDSSGQLDMQQWLRILGQDIEVQQVQVPLDSQEQTQKQSKNIVKKGLKVLAPQKKINKQQKQNKNKGNKSKNKQQSTKNTFAKQQSKLDKTNPPLKNQMKSTKQNENKITKKEEQPKQNTIKQNAIKQNAIKQNAIQKKIIKKQEPKQNQDKLKTTKIQKTPSVKVIQKNSSSKNLSKSVKQSKKQPKKQQKLSKQKQPAMKQSISKSIKETNKSIKSSIKKIVDSPQKQQKITKKDSQKKIQTSLKSVQTKKFVQDQQDQEMNKNNNDQNDQNEDYQQENFDLIEQNQDNLQRSRQQITNLKRTDSDIVDTSNLKSQSAIKKPKREENSSQFVGQFAKLLTLSVNQDGKQKQASGAYKLSDYITMSEQMKKKKQQYLQTAESLKKNNREFIDKSFPASIQSLTNKPNKSVIRNVQQLKWKHYSSIFKNPILFEGTVEPNDIKQGSLGNCYFLSALSCLAQYSNLIQRLFEYSDLKNGYFLVWLCIDGQWQLIQLDGNIPVDSSSKFPAFSQSNKQQLWVILLQKAYAKAYGNYQNINGGQAYEAITDLSGSPGVSFSHSKIKEDQLWQKLLSAQKNKQIMAAGTEQKVQETKKIQGHSQNISKQGIVLGHAYSILDVRQYKGQKIICLRNPWGKVQWNGEWSDTSKKWTSAALKQLNYSLSDEDGIFWMPFTQYFKFYGVSSINYIRPTYYHSSQKQSIKQLVIKINTKKNKSVKQGFLTVSQKDHRHQGLPINTPYQRISLILLAMKDGKITKKINSLSSLYQSQICIEIKQLNDDEQAVVLVTMQKSTDVSVSFYGTQPVKFQFDDQILPYLQGQAYLDQQKGQQFGDLKTWMFSTINRAFICFKNESKNKQKFTITIPKPQNLKLEPPYGPKNLLTIPKGQIKCIKAKIIDYTKSISFGSLGLQQQ